MGPSAWASVVIGVPVAVWVALLLWARTVQTRRYDRLLEDGGTSVAAAVGTAAGAATIEAAVRYNPVAYIASTYDTEEEVGRRLAAAGWRLLHWHRPGPTFLLAVRGGEAVLAFRGTETPEDAAANRSVWGAAYRAGGVRFRLHGGVRRLLAAYLADAVGPLSTPAFRSALRAAGAPDRLTVVGYSLGGSLAAALAVLLRNPRLAPAFGLPVAAATGFLADAGGLSGGEGVHCVAYACPSVFRFGRSGSPPDLRNIATIVKEGDAVPLLSLANLCRAAGLVFPDAWALRPVGALLVVSDEAWRGRSLEWLEENRDPLPAPRVYFAAPGDTDRAAALLGTAALLRAAPAAFRGLALVRPLHSHGRWRWTVDALAREASAAGLPLRLPAMPDGVAD